LEEETVADLLSYILPSVLEIVLDQLQSIKESLSYPMEPFSLTIPSPISIEEAEPLIDTIEGIALKLSVPYYTLLDVRIAIFINLILNVDAGSADSDPQRSLPASKQPSSHNRGQ
jgi:hypothetical protein